MGRLFWKFFFAFLGALLLAGLSVGVVLSVFYPRPDFGEMTQRFVAAQLSQASHLAALLTRQQLHDLWREQHASGAFVPLAVDEKGIELLGRPYQADALKEGRVVRLADGSSLRLLSGPQDGMRIQSIPGSPLRPPAGPPPAPWQGEGLRPVPPSPGMGPPPLRYLQILSGLIAALGFSALLAWYLSKPLRHLQQAFASLAAGHLDTRVAALMGRRRDEIADLGQGFDRMAADLQQLMGAQRRLLHDVSHELRSPLARLSAAIGLVRQDPARLEATLDRVERESARLDLLVGELLTLSRLEAGVQAPKRVVLDIGKLLAELAEDARFEGQSKALAVKLSGLARIELQADYELLYRAFDNLLRNAIRHSPREGTISLTIDDAERATGWLHISIEDEGLGVPESALGDIFEPFHRGAEGVAGEGFGLGLAIARRAIEAHGGSIRARNSSAERQARGLCIEISLPLA